MNICEFRRHPGFCRDPNSSQLDQPLQAKHHHINPRKQTPGAGIKSESGFLSQCIAGFVGIGIPSKRFGLSHSDRYRYFHCGVHTTY